MDNNAVVKSLLERLAPSGGDSTRERIWRFSDRMAAVYQQQMKQFDEDDKAKQWRQLYSVNNMPQPSNTQGITDVAAMMAFYSPTNFCKFQKLVTQQLLDWQARQPQFNPYPFGASRITFIDFGAGVGIAALAAIDVLAAWTDVVADLGYRQLGISIKVISVEPDINKLNPRQKMLNHMRHLLDKHSIDIEHSTEVLSTYPEPESMNEIVSAVPAGSLVICCMSNFLSSPSASDYQTPETFSMLDGSKFNDVPDYADDLIEWSMSDELVDNAVHYAKSTSDLFSRISCRNKLVLASELKGRGPAIRMFAATLHPALELAVHWNRVRFYSPKGSYWYALRKSEHSSDLDWATGFWSLAHWNSSVIGQQINNTVDAFQLGVCNL